MRSVLQPRGSNGQYVTRSVSLDDLSHSLKESSLGSADMPTLHFRKVVTVPSMNAGKYNFNKMQMIPFNLAHTLQKIYYYMANHYQSARSFFRSNEESYTRKRLKHYNYNVPNKSADPKTLDWANFSHAKWSQLNTPQKVFVFLYSIYSNNVDTFDKPCKSKAEIRKLDCYDDHKIVSVYKDSLDKWIPFDDLPSTFQCKHLSLIGACPEAYTNKKTSAKKKSTKKQSAKKGSRKKENKARSK